MSLKESLLEILWIVKTCLTTVWFWIPIVYGLYVVFQFWMFFFIHPLTLLIVPIILCVYVLRKEEKGIRAKFNIPKTKRLKSSHPLGTGPDFMFDVEQRVEEYLSVLERERKKRKK